jgi:hypothetical protein
VNTKKIYKEIEENINTAIIDRFVNNLPPKELYIGTSSHFFSNEEGRKTVIPRMDIPPRNNIFGKYGKNSRTLSLKSM